MWARLLLVLTLAAAYDAQLLSVDMNKYITVYDPVLQQQIWNRVWSRLTSVPCWDSSFVSDPTAFGTVASVTQFSFNGYDQWRHVGYMDTYWGSVKVYSLEQYEGYDAVTMETWSGAYEGFIIGKGPVGGVGPAEGTFLHILSNPSGVLYDVTYYQVLDSARCL
eukprot:TRINITY_DN4705_c0_g1_i1.p1 TRINITY_DN4705_c0_g1~~TRINITY_DN4705_c0_g1_i1.p1  ORF type:complete len:189 (+),score=11.94 TRINITY_DN4705_c0_g1_i1:77-568(+)